MTNPVPLLDLKAQFQSLREEMIPRIVAVLESQYFINGPEVTGLEEEVAKYCGARAAIGVSSGTDALLIALMALGVGPGDEVITSPFTFFATGGSITRLGAKPVFVDILPETFNIDPELIEAAITEKTKAIIPVHIFGQCVDMTAINQIAQTRGIPVLEDAAQAIGAKWDDQRAGSMGTVAAFSFFPSKNLGGLGDGGMVTTNDLELAEKIRKLRNHGQTGTYEHSMIGGNFRLDAIQAAGLRVKLPHLDDWAAGRVTNAERYAKRFAEEGLLEYLRLPITAPGAEHIYNQFTLRAQNRDQLLAHLRAANIGCAVYYPLPLHLQPCFTDLGYKAGSLPITEQAAQEAISLPIFKELTESQQEQVIASLKDFYLG